MDDFDEELMNLVIKHRARVYDVIDFHLVYYEYRNVFTGPKAELRDLQKIRNVLNSDQIPPSISNRGLCFEELVQTVEILLRRSFFSSPEKAEFVFPEECHKFLLEFGAEVPGEKAAAWHAEMLQRDGYRAENDDTGLKSFIMKSRRLRVRPIELLRGEKARNLRSKDQNPAKGGISGIARTPPEAQVPDSHLTTHPKSVVPSLPPIHLTYKVQHFILAATQHILEECCYEYSLKYTPQLLANQNWDCAEAIELNTWISKMLETPHDPRFVATLLAVKKIRHSAVHRLRMNAEEIIRCLKDAVIFTEALLDSNRVLRLQQILDQVRERVNKLKTHKRHQESRARFRLEDRALQDLFLELDEREALKKIMWGKRGHAGMMVCDDETKDALRKVDSKWD